MSQTTTHTEQETVKPGGTEPAPKEASSKLKLVKFNKDVSPHCKGDVVALDSDQLKNIDKIAKKRDIENVYEVQGAAPTDAVQSDSAPVFKD